MIGGGGSRAAFAVGAIEELRRHGQLEFDIVAGAGMGALVAPLVVTDELDVLHEVFSTLESREILRVNLRALFWNAVYDTRPLQRLVEALITEQRFRRLQASARRLLIGTLALQSGHLQYWSQRSSDHCREIVSRATLIGALLASASQPLLMPPVQLPPDSDQHVHGGLADLSPLSIAIKHGATEIYLIVLTPPERAPARQQFSWVGHTGWRFLDVVADELLADDVRRTLELNKTLRYLDGLEARARLSLGAERAAELFSGHPDDPRAHRRPIDLHVIRPERDLPVDDRSYESNDLQALQRLGGQAARRAREQGPHSDWPGDPR